MRRTYSTGQRSYIDFLSLNPYLLNPDGSFLPASKKAILEWVAHLGHSRRILPSTIKSYLGHVKAMHVDADLPTNAIESPVTQRLILGIKRYFGDRNRSSTAPITLDILRRIVAVSQPSDSIDACNTDAAVKLAFSAFMRAGEFCVKGDKFALSTHPCTSHAVPLSSSRPLTTLIQSTSPSRHPSRTHSGKVSLRTLRPSMPPPALSKLSAPYSRRIPVRQMPPYSATPMSAPFNTRLSSPVSVRC